jgi:preprotein translocase subunit YajC
MTCELDKATVHRNWKICASVFAFVVIFVTIFCIGYFVFVRWLADKRKSYLEKRYTP